MTIIFGKHKYYLLFLFLIPINIYVIGDFLGAGIAFPFFKFQITYLGTSVISCINELNYVVIGTYHHRTAISVILWTIGLILLIWVALFLFSLKNIKNCQIKNVGILLILSSISFLFSIFFQYGLLFHGPAGTAIPIGLPVLFVIGGWMYTEGRKEEDGNEEDEVQGIEGETG